MPSSTEPDDTEALVPRARAAARAPGHSLGDWLTTLALFALGCWADTWPPFERALGPQLHDPSIAYPHTPPAAQRVPGWLLWRLTLALPPLLLLPAARWLGPRAVPRGALAAELLLGHLSSVALAFVAVCLAKAMVGRLRPDFLARCVPVAGACTGADAAAIAEGRKSFPSGHSALAFSALAYVSLVWHAGLAARRTARAGGLWRLVAVAAPWTLAAYVALSRLQDYWHHWQDVLAGSLIGHAAAYAAVRHRLAARRGACLPVGLVPLAYDGCDDAPRDAPAKLHRSPPESMDGSSAAEP
jgi:diacylglycerol diphosphate phosphatase/phosphatidate phosphatase